MYQEEWRLNSKIYANLALIDSLDFERNFFPSSVINFSLIPQLNNKNEQVGVYEIQISFSVESELEKIDDEIIIDTARDVFDYITNYLTFLSGERVIVESYILKFKYPDEEDKFRIILTNPRMATITPPLPFEARYLKRELIDSRISRCLSFYSYGISEANIVTSIYFFMSALEILAGMVPTQEMIIKKCENCNFEKELEAGINLRVKNILINIAGLKMGQYKDIWKLRNSLFHGGYAISSSNVRNLHKYRNVLEISIVKILKTLLHLNQADLPMELSNNRLLNSTLSFDFVPKKT